MRTSIDIKSAILGGLVVALVACSIGAVCHGPDASCGRFEMFGHSGHAFVFDPLTGQVWSLQTDLPENAIRTPPHGDQAFYDPKIFDEPVLGEANALSQ